MNSHKKILIIDNLAAFEKIINKDDSPYDINMSVMPGTLENKHKNVDPETGIPILRRRFNLVFLFLGGIHDLHLGAEYRWLKPNDLVIVPENMVCGSSNVRGCKGYCIHFKTEFLQPLLSSSLDSEFPFFNFETVHVINVSKEESQIIQKAFKDIITEYERFSYEKDYLLRNYTYILLLRIREIYRPYIKEVNENTNRAAKIAIQFKHLVEKNFLKKRSVKDYVCLLNVTAKHLSDVVKKTFGKSPHQIINDMLLLESKAQLVSTDKTITEIALDLNFTDQSHFNHFLKQHTGYSPAEYRKKYSFNPAMISFLTGKTKTPNYT